MHISPDVIASITANTYDINHGWMRADADIYSANYELILPQPVSLEATNIDLVRFKATEVTITVRSGPEPDAMVVFAATTFTVQDPETVEQTIGLTKSDALMVSTGVRDVDRPGVVYNPDGTITIAAANVCLFDNATWQGAIRVYRVPGATLSLVDGAQQYLVADYNNGDPIYRIEAIAANINTSNIVAIRVVWRQGLNVHSIDFDSAGLGAVNKIASSIYNTTPYRISTQGGLVLSESTGRVVNVTGATVYAGVYPHAVTAFTSATDVLTRVHHVAGAWIYDDSTTAYDNANYDNGTNTVAMSNSAKFAVRWIYRTIGDTKQVYYVLGTQEWNSVSNARTEPLRSDLPQLVSQHGYLVGRIIVQNGAASGTVDVVASTSFVTGTVTNHNDLSGLQGIGPDYYHPTLAQYTGLTGGADTTLHNHAYDRARANHTGTQLASTISDFSTAADARITVQKGAANGICPLDSGAKVSTIYLPDTILGAMRYQSAWNASTNTPTLPAAAPANKGYYWITSVAGTYNSVGFMVGDWIVSNGTSYDKIDNTDSISSWNGRTGAVLPVVGDYSAFYLGISATAAAATKLATGRTIAMTGDVTWTSPAFDGTANVTAASTLASVVTAGSVGSATQVPVLTYDAKGRITAVSSATITPAGIGAQPALGFTPVQQGGGTGQTTNKLYIGWSADGNLHVQVDSTDFGQTWPIGISGSSADSSKLGGNLPAYYAPEATIANLGTVATDPNTATQLQSCFTQDTAANRPGNYAFVQTLARYNGGSMQIAADSYSSDTNNLWWRRKGDNGTWYPWKTIWHSGNLTQTSIGGPFLPLSAGTGNSLTGVLRSIAPWSGGQIDLGATNQAGIITFRRGSSGEAAASVGYTTATSAGDFQIASVGGTGTIRFTVQAGDCGLFGTDKSLALYGYLTGTSATFSGAVTSAGFVKTGGTASQFLKADGSVDANTYATSSSLGAYLPLAGGTMNAGASITLSGANPGFITTSGVFASANAANNWFSDALAGDTIVRTNTGSSLLLGVNGAASVVKISATSVAFSQSITGTGAAFSGIISAGNARLGIMRIANSYARFGYNSNAANFDPLASDNVAWGGFIQGSGGQIQIAGSEFYQNIGTTNIVTATASLYSFLIPVSGTSASFSGDVVAPTASVTNLRVNNGASDLVNGSPWYGLGYSSTTAGSGKAVQLAGYWGLNLVTGASSGGNPALSISGGVGACTAVFNAALQGTSASFSGSCSASGYGFTAGSGDSGSQFIGGTVASNDYWRVGGIGANTNNGYLEIATADDGNEPIVVRQYTGVFSTVTREAQLLTASGDTTFPRSITAGYGVSDGSSGRLVSMYTTPGYAGIAGNWPAGGYYGFEGGGSGVVGHVRVVQTDASFASQRLASLKTAGGFHTGYWSSTTALDQSYNCLYGTGVTPDNHNFSFLASANNSDTCLNASNRVVIQTNTGTAGSRGDRLSITSSSAVFSVPITGTTANFSTVYSGALSGDTIAVTGTSNSQYYAFATLTISGQYGSASTEFYISNTYGTGQNGNYYSVSGSAKIKQQSAMSNSLAACVLLLDKVSGNILPSRVVAVLTTDTSSLKVVTLYIQCMWSYDSTRCVLMNLDGSVAKTSGSVASLPAGTQYAADWYSRYDGSSVVLNKSLSGIGASFVTTAAGGQGGLVKITAPNLASANNVSLMVGKAVASQQSGFLKWTQGATDAASYMTLETYGGASPLTVSASNFSVTSGGSLTTLASGLDSNSSASATLATWSHKSVTTANAYAIAQSSAGTTAVSAASDLYLSTASGSVAWVKGIAFQPANVGTNTLGTITQQWGNVWSYTITASTAMLSPKYTFSDRTEISSGAVTVLPTVAPGEIKMVYGGSGAASFKAVTSATQACTFRLGTGVFSSAAAGGNAVNLDLANTTALVIGITSTRCQLLC